MSQALSAASGRGKPRWSLVIGLGGEAWSVQSANGIASIAGLPVCSAIVLVGPPLLLRPAGSSIGSVLLWLPVVLKLHVESSEMLYPASWMFPEQLPMAV